MSRGFSSQCDLKNPKDSTTIYAPGRILDVTKIPRNGPAILKDPPLKVARLLPMLRCDTLSHSEVPTDIVMHEATSSGLPILSKIPSPTTKYQSNLAIPIVSTFPSNLPPLISTLRDYQDKLEASLKTPSIPGPSFPPSKEVIRGMTIVNNK